MFVGMGLSRCGIYSDRLKKKPRVLCLLKKLMRLVTGALGGNDDREQTLNQLLTEMNGVKGNSGVIILAATNRLESLDTVLTRSGALTDVCRWNCRI